MTMSVIGALRVTLGLDSAAFEQGASLAEKRLSKFSKDMGKLGDKWTSFGQTMTLGVTAPLVAFGGLSFKAASDAAELQSAFDQTFGVMASDMTAWAEATGDAMGRSTQEMQKGANTFGIFFNQAAKTRTEAAEMSKTFTVLAQDLSSFYNVDPGTAMEKLRSGLSGESEPLRDFGVFLTEAAVNAKGLEMGLGGLTGELTEQEKILARYQLILESTKNAQGDVARTSDGTANQMRKAQAAFDELQVVVGTKLLPVLTPLIEKIATGIEWFTKLPDPVQNATIGFAAFAAAIGPLAFGVGQTINLVGQVVPLFGKLGPLLKFLPTLLSAVGVAFRFMLGPIGLAITAVGALYLAWKNWDKIKPILVNLYEGAKTWIKDKLGAIFDWAKQKVDAFVEPFKNAYIAIVGNSYIPDMVDEIGVHMARLQQNLVDPAVKTTQAATESFEELGNRVGAIFDRLFPEERAFLDFQADRDALAKMFEKGAISATAYWQALRRLGQEYATTADQMAQRDQQEILPVRPDDIPQLFGEFLEVPGAVEKDFAEPLLTTFERVARGVADSLADMEGSLRGFVTSIKKGDIIGIIGGIADIIGSFTGAFRMFKSFSATPGKASGGPITAGRPYLVGERGPELIVPNTSGSVIPNGRLRGQDRVSVEVIKGEMFDVVVRRMSTQVANEQIGRAAPGIAAQGAAGAVKRLARIQDRRLA